MLMADHQRYARTTNAMSPDTRAIHARIERWARWARDMGSLGFPSRSVHEKVNEGGITAGSPRPPIAMPADVAVTDAAIAKLCPVDQTVIKQYYLRWEPNEVLWKRCGGVTSLGNFRIVLKRARWRILYWIQQLDR